MSKIRQMVKSEKGMVSFLITMIMMIVISLIVVGFTQVANRNRRETLDRQLSTQAFYAAESGVNDAATKIHQAQTLGNPVATQTECTGGTYLNSSADGNLNSDGSVKYTCVLVNPLVPNLVTRADTQSSSVLSINPTDAGGGEQTASSLTFTWSPATGQTGDVNTCTTISSFPTTGSNTCPYALLRVDLMVGTVALGDSPAGLNDKTVTFFMQPIHSGSGHMNLGGLAPQKAYVVAANCGTTTCSVTIKFTESTTQSQHYYARISTLYRDSPNVTVDGEYTGGSTWFKDAQAIVDVTGKAQDVLRRVQVRVRLQDLDRSNVPNAAVQSSGNVCKRFAVYPGSYADYCP